MTDESTQVPSAENPATDEVMVLLTRMKQQMDFLEKKIDTLLNQSKEKSYPAKTYGDKPYAEKRFEKPFRSSSFKPEFRREEKGGAFKPEFRRDKEERYAGPKPVYSSHPKKRASGGAFEHGSNFKKRKGEQSQGFAHTKKPGFFKKKDRA